MSREKEFSIKYLDEEPVRPLTPVQRTLAAMHDKWAYDNGRINQGRAFVKRARKSDRRRKLEKAARKRNRR